MIEQEIKDKLKLTPTGSHNGVSFINNCETTWSKLLQCYIADCDVNGNPLKGKYVAYNRGNGKWRSAEFSHEFIMDAPKDILVKQIKAATTFE